MVDLELFLNLSYPQEWGNHAILRIRPQDDELMTMLPPMNYYLWLISDATDDSCDGSELIVSWFGEINHGRSLEEILRIKLKKWTRQSIARIFAIDYI